MLLVGIAVHGYRIEAHDEDPQRGSAFAMFATVDIGATRRVVATAPGDEPIALQIPGELDDERAALADAPSDQAARQFADLLRSLTWDVEGRAATVGGGTTLDTVRVEVVALDADGRTLSTRVLADGVVGTADS